MKGDTLSSYRDLIKCSEEVSLYLDEKGVDCTMRGYDFDTLGGHHISVRPSHQLCYELNCISREFWERVVRIGLEEIATKRNCKLNYLWRKFMDYHNGNMTIVFYVVNK